MAKRSRYDLISEEIVVEETPLTSYGIRLIESGQETARYADISPDRETVARLVSLLNEMDAQRVHLEDILEDFLP